MESSPSDAETVCPVCSSTNVVQGEAVEHKKCGCIRPASEFQTEEGTVCPECRSHDGEFEHIGTLSVCSNGHRFDEQAVSIRQPTSDTTPSELLDHDSPIRQSTSWTRRIVTVVLVTLIVTTGIGGAVFAAPYLQDDGGGDGSWETYQSIVVFRNDDPQPYYQSEALSNVHDVFIEEGVPLTDAVIPYPGNESIAGTEFCNRLRTQKANHPDLIEFAVHGYTHANRQPNFTRGSEFGGLSAEKQQAFLRQGKEAVHRCVGNEPTTFVPPRNTYDKNTVREMKATGYETISSHEWFTKQYYNQTGVFIQNDVTHVPSTHEFVEQWGPVKLYDRAELERRFDEAYQNQEIYVQTIHYTMFNTSDRIERLRWFVQYTKSKEDVKFMTVGELGRHFRQDTIRKTDEGWRVYESSNSEYTTADRLEMSVKGFWQRIAVVSRAERVMLPLTER